MDFASALDAFFYAYNPTGNGPKLSLFLTGGGFSVLDFAKLPGASNILDSSYMPYSNEAIFGFLLNKTKTITSASELNSCSSKMAIEYAMALHQLAVVSRKDSSSNEADCIAVTAALTSSRYRRGDNRAYVAFIPSGEIFPVVFKICLSKISEEEHRKSLDTRDMRKIRDTRLLEDNKIAQLIFALACRSHSLLPDLSQGETISRVTKNIAWGSDIQMVSSFPVIEGVE